MLEVHHIRRERSTAIQAQHGAKLTQELNGVALTFLDPAKLCLAMGLVVEEVVRTLVPFAHQDQLEQLFAPCQ